MIIQGVNLRKPLGMVVVLLSWFSPHLISRMLSMFVHSVRCPRRLKLWTVNRLAQLFFSLFLTHFNLLPVRLSLPYSKKDLQYQFGKRLIE